MAKPSDDRQRGREQLARAQDRAARLSVSELAGAAAAKGEDRRGVEVGRSVEDGTADGGKNGQDDENGPEFSHPQGLLVPELTMYG